MGKKMKPKARNPRKLHHRVAAGSGQPVSERSDQKTDVGDEGVMDREMDGGHCNHYSKGSAELNRILLRILPSKDADACEHCREEPANRRGGKEKGKQHKKKGGGKASEGKSESHVIWVCLDCNRYFCGGTVNDSAPYGHARRHSKQERHSWAVRLDNPSIGWCFSCNSEVQIKMPEGAEEEAKSVMEDKRVENGEGALASVGTKGNVIRGLANLGNTCFFNSVMQNLFTIDKLRDYMLSLDQPAGPVTMALKKLFVETSGGAEARGVLNPKSLFGCLCSKAPQFRGYQQQDSHELLRCLLDLLYMEERTAEESQDSLDEQGKAASSSGATIVDAIFGGQLSSTVCCVECGHTSVVHEPFLDLSLPVPSKKPPSKKAPPPPPKRNKPPLRERNRSRKFREKGSSKGSPLTEKPRVGTSNSPSECSETGFPASKPEYGTSKVEEASECNKPSVPASKVEQPIVSEAEDFWWMDYLDGPNTAPDGSSLDFQTCEDSVAECSDSGQVCQKEIGMQCNLESQGDCSKELIMPSDSCAQNFCGENVPSYTQDSGVLLLPYKETNPPNKEIDETASFSQNSDSQAPTNALVKESSFQTTSVACSEQAEVDFEGFSDMFNEPEVTSEMKRTETGLGDEMDVTLWASNSSESNQEEVDDTNAPVSINSCLALFTKPELLSDEQAWHCERCSEVMSHHNVGCRKNKRQALGRLHQTEALKPQVDKHEVRNRDASPNLQLTCAHPTAFNVLGNGETSCSSKDINAHVERLDNLTAKVDCSQKPLDFISGSNNVICKDMETRKDSDLELSGPTLSSHPHRSGGLLKDEDSMESYPEKTIEKENSDGKKVSCSVNDLQEVGSGGRDVAAASTSLPDNMRTSFSNSCKNDNISEVKHMGKKDLQLLDESPLVEDSGAGEEKSEGRKLLRDATKRILIYSAPSILTIHLKRFGQDARGRLSKLRGHVSFQETLDLRPYMDPRCEEKDKCAYRLIGLVEHSGGMGGGHYVAYVRGERGGGKTKEGITSPAWFYASDAHVRETSLSEVLQSEAYILFYERV